MSLGPQGGRLGTKKLSSQLAAESYSQRTFGHRIPIGVQLRDAGMLPGFLGSPGWHQTVINTSAAIGSLSKVQRELTPAGLALAGGT